MSWQYGELRSTKGWVRFGSLETLEHPSKFQRVSRLDFVTASTSLKGRQPNFARCLAVSCDGTLYIHFRGLLSPKGILPDAKFTFRPSLALSYIGSVTPRHSSSERLSNFAALRRGRHLYSRWTSANILIWICGNRTETDSRKQDGLFLTSISLYLF